MGELTGKLIEMNVHMIRPDGAMAMISFGLILGAAMAFVAVCSIGVIDWKASAVFAALAIGFFVLFLVGIKQPRIKEIHACADGPVSLEQISVVYDVVNVDGKELILRER